jgi:hypothetical protein
MSGGGGGGGPWRPEEPIPQTKRGGSGKTGGGGGDDGGMPPEDPCAIFEKATLNSPNRTVLGTLRAGDLLDVVYLPGPPRLLVAQSPTGSVAGSITSPSMLRIIQCISQRNRAYVAEVLSIRGAVCEVQIRPR